MNVAYAKIKMNRDERVMKDDIFCYGYLEMMSDVEYDF